MMRSAARLCLVVFVVAAWCAPAAADELSDFEVARRAYDNQDYEKAERGLESLVGGVVPRARNPVVRLEARKYLGASYLFLGKKDKANEQFRLLLEEDEEYDLDPVAFPQALVTAFREVKADVQTQKSRARQEQTERENRQRQEEMQALLRQQDRLRQLEELARTETVERVNSRWIATLPFGIGQFQNGHRRFGIGLAVMQSALLVASVTTFIGHNSLRGERPDTGQIDRARRVEKALRVGNWVTSGLLGGLVIVGVTDAHVRFKPVIRSTRPRALPAEVEEAAPEAAGLQLELGLTGIRAKLRF